MGPIRVTSGDLVPRLQAYWPTVWIGSQAIYTFVGRRDGQVHFYAIDRTSKVVTDLGPLLRDYPGEGEGWYWDREGWVVLIPGGRSPQLICVNPFTKDRETLIDLSASHPGHVLWQPHSSEDGRTHSATVQRTSDWQKVATVVARDGQIKRWYDATQPLDESAVTLRGDYVFIKEGEDNRVGNVETGEEWWIQDADGALGHSDCGDGFVVGEYSQGDHGECVIWDLRTRSMRTLYRTWNFGHLATKGGRALVSTPDPPWINLLNLSTGELTPLKPHGMSGSRYDLQAEATLDWTGRVAVYLTETPDGLGLELLGLP